MSMNNYPTHEYSKYVDMNFSFSNKVTDTAFTQYPDKHTVVDQLKNMRCNGTMMLEPRLQEYIKKKKYYRTHKIKPCIPFEKEFRITKNDKKVIKRFLKGKPISQSLLNKSGQHVKQQFPSSMFKKDHRVPENNKPEYEVPQDSSLFAQSGFDLNDTRLDPRADTQMDFGPEKYDKFSSQYRLSPRSTKHQINKCKNKSPNQNTKSFDHYNTIDNLIASNTISRPGQSNTTLGMPTHTKKSYGYRRMDDHFFDFIDSDFQNPINSVEAWQRGGESTRRDNKRQANQNYF